MTQKIKITVGKAIRFYRKERGLTQLQLSEIINKTEETISMIERGINNISIETLENIAYALNINPQDLMTNVKISKKNLENNINNIENEFNKIQNNIKIIKKEIEKIPN